MPLFILLVGEILPEEYLAIRVSTDPQNIQTANGVVECKYVTEVYIKDLDDTFTFYVLEDSPAVLSTGILCMEKQYSFYWLGGNSPVVVSPGGYAITCAHDHLVPAVVTGTPADPKFKDGQFKFVAKNLSEPVDLDPDLPEPPPKPPADRNVKPDLGTIVTEELRKYQKNLIYKPVPKQYKSLSCYFYDDKGVLLHERLNIIAPKKGTFCYRTLDQKNNASWDKVKRVVYYSGEQRLRVIDFIDPKTYLDNPQDPNISKNHNLTHFPKDPKCEVCNLCRFRKKPTAKRFKEGFAGWDEPKDFCDLLTCDHMVIAERKPQNRSRHGHKYAFVLQDYALKWLDCFPSRTKTGDETAHNCSEFLGPSKRPKVVYSDNSGEIKSAMTHLNILHATCTPHVPQSNGVAENSVKRVKEGTRCLIVQSGLSHHWWAEAMRTYCFLRNISDIMEYGSTPYHRRFGPFPGHVIPFGAQVQYAMPPGSSVASHEPNKPFAQKYHTGIFMGYRLHPGGKWSGDYEILDAEQLSAADSTEGLHLKKVKDILKPKLFNFPVKDISIKQPEEPPTESFIEEEEEE